MQRPSWQRDSSSLFGTAFAQGPKCRSGGDFRRIGSSDRLDRYVDLVNKRLAIVACATAAVASLGACTKTPAEPAVGAGQVAVGTAAVTVNGQDLGKTDAVSCVREGAFTTITTGDASAGTTAVIDNQKGLTTKSVSIRNLGGFTGSYWAGLDGSADLHTTGVTYELKGEALGFNADKPSQRTTGSYVIRVAC